MGPDAVPLLDLRRAASEPDAFAAEVGQAYRRSGFCRFSHHGIDEGLIGAALAAFERFFGRPEAEKSALSRTAGGGGRGYVGFRIETARTSDLPDLKEFFHVGREGDPSVAPNVWPPDPGFREAAVALYAAMEAAGQRVLAAIARDLGLEADWFARRTGHGDSILRALHYPPVDPALLPAVRAEAHEDISLITLLIGATASGLELLDRDGQWRPVPAEPGTLVVNVGDMLQRLTCGVYPSTTHRVVNPSGAEAARSRYSLPFFLAPDPDLVLRAVPGCEGEGAPVHEPVTAEAYLMQRLREIRLQQA